MEPNQGNLGEPEYVRALDLSLTSLESSLSEKTTCLSKKQREHLARVIIKLCNDDQWDLLRSLPIRLSKLQKLGVKIDLAEISAVKVRRSFFYAPTFVYLMESGAPKDILSSYLPDNEVLNATFKFRSTRLTPLHLAVRNFDEDLVEFLISSGADVNVYDSAGRTPLSVCVADPDSEAEILEPLIEAGADPLAKRKTARSALDVAIKRKDLRLTNFLLDSIRDKPTEFADYDFSKFIDPAAAIANSKLKPSEKDRLLDFVSILEKVSPFLSDSERLEIFSGSYRHYGLYMQKFLSSVMKQFYDPELVERAIKLSESVDASYVYCLELAAARNDLETCERLFEAGAYPREQQEGSEVSALEFLSEANLQNLEPTVLNSFLDNGLDINFVDRQNRTLLTRALRARDSWLRDSLVVRGATIGGFEPHSDELRAALKTFNRKSTALSKGAVNTAVTLLEHSQNMDLSLKALDCLREIKNDGTQDSLSFTEILPELYGYAPHPHNLQPFADVIVGDREHPNLVDLLTLVPRNDSRPTLNLSLWRYYNFTGEFGNFSYSPLQDVATISHSFRAWKYDALTVTDRSDPGNPEVLSPSLFEQFGFRRVPERPTDFFVDDDGIRKPYWGTGFEIVNEVDFLKMGITGVHSVEFRQAYIALTTDLGTLVVRNSSPHFGRDKLPSFCYFTSESLNGGERRNLTLEDLNYFANVSKVMNLNPDKGETPSHLLYHMVSKLYEVIDAYSGWKCETRVDKAWKYDKFVGGQNSPGFKPMLRHLCFLDEAIQAENLEKGLNNRIELSFNARHVPPWFSLPYSVGEGEEIRTLPITEDTLQVLIDFADNNASREDVERTGIHQFLQQAGINQEGHLIISVVSAE